jgi:hypothetical protein
MHKIRWFNKIFPSLPAFPCSNPGLRTEISPFLLSILFWLRAKTNHSIIRAALKYMSHNGLCNSGLMGKGILYAYLIKMNGRETTINTKLLVVCI